MSFVKNAADELLGPAAEDERQVHRSRVRNLLMSLGVLGAGAGAAYYLGKNHGANWNSLMGSTGAAAPKAPVSGAQGAVNSATNALGISRHPTAANPTQEQQQLALPMAGAVTGGAAGAAYPKATSGRSLTDIADQASAPDSPIAKRMDAVNANPGGAPGDMAAEINRSQRPVSPDAKSNSLFQQLAAVGRGKPISPLAGPSSILPNVKSWLDRRAVEQGALKVRDSGGKGVHSVGGQTINHSDLATGIKANHNVEPGQLASHLQSFGGRGAPTNARRAASAGLGALLGGLTGKGLDAATMPDEAPVTP